MNNANTHRQAYICVCCMFICAYVCVCECVNVCMCVFVPTSIKLDNQQTEQPVKRTIFNQRKSVRLLLPVADNRYWPIVSSLCSNRWTGLADAWRDSWLEGYLDGWVHVWTDQWQLTCGYLSGCRDGEDVKGMVVVHETYFRGVEIVELSLTELLWGWKECVKESKKFY